MALSKDDILNAIAEMTVMDVVDLIKAMEEKFGVSAAAASISVPVAPVAFHRTRASAMDVSVIAVCPYCSRTNTTGFAPTGQAGLTGAAKIEISAPVTI